MVAQVLLIALRLHPHGSALSATERVDYERAVERTRYEFVIGNTQPFDATYPYAFFEQRVAREMAEERVLKSVFRLEVTADLLAQELDRIDHSTRASDQWTAIRATLHQDPRLIEEVFCRPLLVDRALRERFAFDLKIHAGQHQKAREAREALLAGKPIPEAKTVLLSRRTESAPTTDELLGRAKEQASLPRVLSVPGKTPGEGPVSPNPEVAAVLKKELKRAGDVTRILEERDRFEVFRLIGITRESWRVEVARFPKLDFDSWLETRGKSLKGGP